MSPTELPPYPSALQPLPSDLFTSPSDWVSEPIPASEWDPRILAAIAGVTCRYQPLEKIGVGASAAVFRALDTLFNRQVALKRFHPEALAQDDAESDYHSELAAISQVCHPHVVRAYDLDEDEEGPFLIFELIEGEDLEQKLAQRPFTQDEVASFLVQALEALNAIHQVGLIHLDLKPANFMATRSAHGIPHYTVIDFGRACDAKREQERRENGSKTSLRGSLHYMAPEQFTKSCLDARTDLYALGAIAYELLTGQKAFEGDNAVQVMAAHLTGRFTPLNESLPEIQPGIAAWITALLAINPEARPQSAKEALRSFLSLATPSFGSLPVVTPFLPLARTA